MFLHEIPSLWSGLILLVLAIPLLHRGLKFALGCRPPSGWPPLGSNIASWRVGSKRGVGRILGSRAVVLLGTMGFCIFSVSCGLDNE
jgi:hypothetical protein